MTQSTDRKPTLAPSDADSYLVPQTIAKPRSFTGLMSLYESNYLRLRQLVPDLASIVGTHCSDAPADIPLHLQILERTRYTCTLTLTYWFAEDGRHPPATAITDDALAREDWFADPDLLVRVYFDGKLAEVMRFRDDHRHRVLRSIAATHREELDQRWKRNVMLNKWLDFCLDSGHRFPTD
ncbi:MAG: DUF1249 domain-containing protein [Pseudomonadota bacterium]